MSTEYDVAVAHGWNGPYTVGPGIEMVGLWRPDRAFGPMDISDTNIYIDHADYLSYLTPYEFNGFRIYDIDNSLPDFLNVTINPETNYSGFDSSRITFDADNIYVNLRDLFGNDSTILSLDVEAASAVPEPTTLAIWGMFGGLGLIAARKRRKRVA